MPESEGLSSFAFRNFSQPYAIEISNENLGFPEKWKQDVLKSINNSKLNGHIKSEDDRKKALASVSDAITGNKDFSSLSSFTRTAAISNFRKKWNNDDAIANISSSNLRASDWLGMHWELERLAYLLDSKGIEYYFDVKAVKTLERYPEASNRNIKWIIKVYPYNLANDTFYRFSVSALINKKRIQVVKNSGSEATINISIRFKSNESNPITVGNILASTLNQEIPDFASFSQAIDSIGTVDSISTKLGPLSKTITGLVSGGLLSGTKNASIISGAIIDINKEEVVPIVGVNWSLFDISRDVSAGITFGVEPSGDASVFVGPSISADVATFSFGTRISGKNDELDFGLGALISVDVSRLFGNRTEKVLEACSTANSCIVGGNFFKKSEDLAKNQAFIGWNLTGEPEQVLITRLENDQELESYQLNQLASRKSGPNIRFVPAGMYKYTIKEPYQLEQLTGRDEMILRIHYPKGYVPFKMHELNGSPTKIIQIGYFKIAESSCQPTEFSLNKPFDFMANKSIDSSIGKIRLKLLDKSSLVSTSDFKFELEKDLAGNQFCVIKDRD